MGLGVLGLLAVLAMAFGRAPARLYVVRLSPVALFAVTGLLVIVLVPAPEGAAVARLPLVEWSVPRQGADFVAALVVKSGLVVLFVTALASRLGERDLLEGLTGLRLPAKLVGLCYMTVRGLHLVNGEVRRLVRGRDARGRPSGMRAVRVASAMTGVLMVRLARRAEIQALALAARGFEGRIALCEPRSLSPLELGLMILVGVVLICLTRL